MNKKIGLAVAGFLLLVGLMTYLVMTPGQVACEVCIEFHGRVECRKATGKDRQEAEMAAAGTACSLIAGGVTEGIACQNTTPKSATCEQR